MTVRVGMRIMHVCGMHTCMHACCRQGRWSAWAHTLALSFPHHRDRHVTGYAIPRGGLFEYVSAPNYLGEMVEWVGWALAAWSLPTAAFAAFTVANLAPRGWRHHQWYRQRFPNYPRGRRALIPSVI